MYVMCVRVNRIIGPQFDGHDIIFDRSSYNYLICSKHIYRSAITFSFAIFQSINTADLFSKRRFLFYLN